MNQIILIYIDIEPSRIYRETIFLELKFPQLLRHSQSQNPRPKQSHHGLLDTFGHSKGDDVDWVDCTENDASAESLNSLPQSFWACFANVYDLSVKKSSCLRITSMVSKTCCAASSAWFSFNASSDCWLLNLTVTHFVWGGNDEEVMRFKGNLVLHGVLVFTWRNSLQRSQNQSIARASGRLPENSDILTQRSQSTRRAARHFSQSVLLGTNGSEPAEGEM